MSLSYLNLLIVILLLEAVRCSTSSEPCAVDITPINTYPIADQYDNHELSVIFARIHRLAVHCGTQMRAKHLQNEQANLDVVKRVGVTGNFQEIAKARMYWALNFVNFVERMVYHKQMVTNRLFDQLEQRLRINQSTRQILQEQRQQSSNVLLDILLRCRQEVTATVHAAIEHERLLHLAAVAASQQNEESLVQWQLALEADAAAVSDRLQQVTEANLEDGYRLLDGFDRRYREIVGENC